MSTLDLLLKKNADGETEAAAEVSIPKTKTAVGKLKAAELDAVAGQLGIADDDWSAMSVADKKAKLNDVLFSDEGNGPNASADGPAETIDGAETGATVASNVKIGAKKSSYASDPLAQMAKEIEKLDSQSEIEARITDTIQQGAVNEFALGGLLAKLNDVGDFGEYKNFGEYVEAKYDMKYRKARYLIAIYTALIDLEIPAAEVQKVGWTKMKELVPVLTSDNYAEWFAKAQSMNTDSLIAEVKAHVSGGVETSEGQAEAQPVKTITSKTLKLHDDQLETFNEAVAKAKAVIGTDSDTVAIDAILMEYIGNAPVAKTKTETKTVEVEKPVLDPQAFWGALKEQFPDDPKSAMVHAFGEDAGFDENFPTVVLDIQFSEGGD